MRSRLLIASLVLFLSACHNATPAPPPTPAKLEVPTLDTLPTAVRAPSFTERIAIFLSGRLPAPTDSASRTPPVSSSTQLYVPPSSPAATPTRRECRHPP